MSKTVLKNVIRFTGLVIGVPVAQPHGLNVSGIAVAPEFVIPNAPGFTITVNALNVTVTRTANAGAAVDVYTEFWHTIEAVTPAGNLAGFVPFIASGGDAAPPTPTTQFAAARCDPNPPTNVTIAFQTGQFQNPSVYGGVGIYTINLLPIPGLVSANQVLWTATAFTPGKVANCQPGFSAGHATVGVRIITSDTGVAFEDSFYLHAEIIGL